MFLRSLISTLLLLTSITAFTQKQVVVLKKGKIIHRFHPGDDIFIKVKGNSERIHSYVNNILDEALVLHRDTIPFESIERTYIEEGSLLNLVGAFLVTGGTGYFLLDEINNRFTIDQDVVVRSATLVAVGLPLLLSKRKSQKLSSYKYRLLTVKRGDPLYR